MQNRPQAEEDRADEAPPQPDQDGPHDVPDSQVIEKTLPASPKKRDEGKPGA